MKTAIVTGANGFIGSNVVRELIAHSIYVIAIHKESNDASIPDSPFVTKVALDVNNIEQLIYDGVTAEVFFHFAWNGSAGASRAKYEQQLDNIKMTLSCVKTAKLLGCKRFVNAGSISEDEAMAACSAQGLEPGNGLLYGQVKQTANHMAKLLAAEYGIEYLAGKISNSYGVGETSPRLLNTIMRKIIAGDQLAFTKGIQNYDFVYITDVAAAFRLIAEKGKPFHEYRIGSGNPKPLREYLQELLDAVAPGYAADFGSVPFTGENLPLESYSISLLQEHCGFRPKVAFDEGIKRLFCWLKTMPTPHSAPENSQAANELERTLSIEATKLEKLIEINPFVSYDNRGRLVKHYSSDFFDIIGVPYALKEVFFSESKPGVLRGLHFQHTSWQGKIVRVAKGKVYDVVVDIRKNSPTYGQWQGFILTEHMHKGLLVPAGFAHGFLALEQSIVSYECNKCFVPEYDSGIRYDDQELCIDWRRYWNGDFIVSDKDLSLGSFSDYCKSEIAFI